ncbi:TetR family transcriptional regulator [Salinisphaera sp. PC39]|uniref:TetR/AcrR family transcriptional regulator n=1 Tax=Salinisphaera sp. PC39 TaxID=1304156 RepID=UPI00333FD0E5
MNKPLRSRRRYRGRTPEQLAAERRDRLLKAALALFAERGYTGTPIETLCATARVATRHFYEQFDGREAVLKALFDDIFEHASREISAALADDSEDLDARVGNAIRAAMQYLLEDPRRARVFCLESIGVSREMEAHRRARVRDIAGLVHRYADALQASGMLPERDYTLPSVALIGAVFEMMEEWLTTDTGLDADGLAREAVLIFRAMIIGARFYEDERPPKVEA